MPDRLTLALIGAGNIAEFAHLPALTRHGEIDLRWVVDANEQLAAKRAASWGAERWAPDYRRALDDPDVDAVDICLPPRLHKQATLDALAAGKHVLLEKPMVLDLREAHEIRAAVERSDRCFMVAENWYFAPAVTGALAHLRSGAIGEPFLIRMSHDTPFRIPPYDGDPGVGWLLSVGTHVFSTTRMLLGEPTRVFAIAAQQVEGHEPIVESDVAATAEFKPGLIGSFCFTARSPHLGERRLAFSIFGSEGLVEFEVWSGLVRLTRGDTEVTELPRTPSRGYDEEVDHFVRCVRDGTTPTSDVDDQIKTLAVVAAARQSLTTRQPEEVRTEA